MRLFYLQKFVSTKQTAYPFDLILPFQVSGKSKRMMDHSVILCLDFNIRNTEA